MQTITTTPTLLASTSLTKIISEHTEKNHPEYNIAILKDLSINAYFSSLNITADATLTNETIKNGTLLFEQKSDQKIYTISPVLCLGIICVSVFILLTFNQLIKKRMHNCLRKLRFGKAKKCNMSKHRFTDDSQSGNLETQVELIELSVVSEPPQFDEIDLKSEKTSSNAKDDVKTDKF